MAGNVFHELIQCGLIPVTVLDQIFRQSKDNLIAYNAKFINKGTSKLYYGNGHSFGWEVKVMRQIFAVRFTVIPGTGIRRNILTAGGFWTNHKRGRIGF